MIGMNAKTALLRIAARQASRPDFDPTGIPDVENLVNELKRHCPEFFDQGQHQTASTSPIGNNS